MNKLVVGKNAVIDIPEDFGGVNYMVLGAPGSGKTRYLLEPLLLQMNKQSHIIVDIKGSLYDDLHKRLEKNGYETKVFDFINFNCDHYNPIEFVYSEEDALALATAIIGVPAEKEDPFWKNNAINVLTALIGYAADYRYYAQYYRKFDQIHPKDCHLNFDQMKPGKPLGLPTVLKLLPEVNEEDYAYKNALRHRIAESTPEGTSWWPCERLALYDASLTTKTAQTILMSIQSETNAFISERIEQMMLDNDFDPLRLSARKTAIFIQLKDYDASLHQVASLMITQAVNALIEYAGNDCLEIPVQIWMDDCGSYSVPHLTDYLACCRSRGIGFTLLCQSEHQLLSKYGDINGETIVQCCHTYIYMGGEDRTSAIRISERGNVMLADILSMDRRSMYIIQQGQKLNKVLKHDEYSKQALEQTCQLSPAELEKEYWAIDPEYVSEEEIMDHELKCGHYLMLKDGTLIPN
jgi:type IV secretion system protein VirD4